VATGDDNGDRGETDVEVAAEKAAKAARIARDDADHELQARALMSAAHADGLRETLRQVNHALRNVDRTFARAIPVMSRLADELELARRGRLGPDPIPVDEPEPA